jgi:hypothetical protein
MKIEVEQRHIDAGKKQSVFENPVSLAMKDAGLKYPHFGGLDDSFGGSGFWFFQCGPMFNQVRFKLEPKIIQWLIDFNNNKPVNPVCFEIEVARSMRPAEGVS